MRVKNKTILATKIETPHSKAGEESDSVKDFFSVLFAYPAAEPTGNALTGIQEKRPAGCSANQN